MDTGGFLEFRQHALHHHNVLPAAVDIANFLLDADAFKAKPLVKLNHC